MGGVKERDAEDEFTVSCKNLSILDKQNVDKLSDLFGGLV